MGFLYNWKLKAAGLWGNLIVSAIGRHDLCHGRGQRRGQSANPLLWIFGLIAFIFDLAEESQGMPWTWMGIRKEASRSIAILYGKIVCAPDFRLAVWSDGRTHFFSLHFGGKQAWAI